MNAKDIIKYGHEHVRGAVKDLSDSDWRKIGATTAWSIKDVMAHLASYELLLEEALRSVATPGAPTPTIDSQKAEYAGFNDGEIKKREALSPGEVMAEYTATHTRVTELADSMTPELLRKAGTIPWYGEGYSLDDFIVFANYGHKQEHIAQIKGFRKRAGL